MIGTSVISFIVVLGILIFVHEFGHFIVAKFFGVGVERFSLGFGPRLIGKTVGITDYRISAIPLGGYVKMVGEEPDAELEPDEVAISFTHKHVAKRACIVAAGPFFNLLLAFVIFLGFYLVLGFEDIKPVIRAVRPDSPAAAAGLKPGDRILAIGDEKVRSWFDIEKAIEDASGETMDLAVARKDESFATRLTPQVQVGRDIFGDEVEYFDMGISGFPELEPVVGEVSPGFPAQKAGLKPGDRIVAVNGDPVDSWRDMSLAISESKGQQIRLTVSREGDRLEIPLTPALRKEETVTGETVDRYLIGISAAGIRLDEEDRIVRRLGPLTAVTESFYRTWFIIKLSVKGIVKIADGSVSSNNLGGPIMIAKMAGDQAKAGLDKLIQFIALISINLAILNILPIPVLDGGHLLFFFIEAVIRRPVGIRVREIAQQAGMVLLLMLMIFVFYNDITRYFFS